MKKVESRDAKVDRQNFTLSKSACCRVGFAVLALAVLTIAVYAPALNYEFIDLDVAYHLTSNPQIRGLSAENLLNIFTSRGTTTSFYPFRTLSYAVDYQFWGLDPRGFKLTNLLLHLANALLVLALIVRLAGRTTSVNSPATPAWTILAAMLGAGIYAVHPVVVEPVVWVPGREELLMVLGILGCFHFHLTARRWEGDSAKKGRVVACYFAAAGCVAVACFSNAVAAVAPMLVVAWDLWSPVRPSWRRIVYGTAALWVIAVSSIAVKRSGIHADHGTQHADLQLAAELSPAIEKIGYRGEYRLPEVGVLTPQRLMLVQAVFGMNVRQVLWPTRLAVCYEPVVVRGFQDRDVVLGGALLVLAVASLWLLRKKTLLAFGLTWFLIALAPTAQIMPHHLNRADRFLYLPLVGLALIVASGLQLLATRSALRNRALAAAGCAALILLAAYSRLAHVPHWQDTIAMWENCVAVNSNNIVAHQNLANELAQVGEFERAFQHYDAALRMNPFNMKVLNQFTTWLIACDDARLRDYDRALTLAEYACRLSQGSDEKSLRILAEVYNESAIALANGGQTEMSIEYFGKARQTQPRWPVPIFNLSSLLATCQDPQFRRPQEAVRLAEAACQLAGQPTADQWMILATAYDAAEQFRHAAETQQKALEAAAAAGDTAQSRMLRQRLDQYRARHNLPAID